VRAPRRTGKYRPAVLRATPKTELPIPTRIIQSASIEAATLESLAVKPHGLIFEVAILHRLQRADRCQFELPDEFAGCVSHRTPFFLRAAPLSAERS